MHNRERASISLPSKRSIDVDHYDDLIAIKVAAENVVRDLGKDHVDSPAMQHLIATLNYRHKS